MKWSLYFILSIAVLLVGAVACNSPIAPDPVCPDNGDNPTMASPNYCVLINDRVTNSAGADLGIVKNVIVDIKDGHLVYVIVSFDAPAFYGKAAMIPLKNKIVPIPWEKLAFGTTQKAILLNVDETMLASAPRLNDVSQGIDRKLDAEIRQYWSKAEDGETCCPCRWCPVWWN
jgi:sporulation protein YlmC with PRC-barrel domain